MDAIVFADEASASHAISTAAVGGIDAPLAAEHLDDGTIRIAGPADVVAALAAVDVAPETVSAAVLADARASAMVRVVTYADAITARITARYPAAEVASWPTREAESRLIAAGGTAADAPLLAAVAAATGADLTDLAAAVLVKAAGYRQVVAAVEAVRTRGEAAIGSCQTPAAVETALTALRDQAEALAAQMGIGPA